MVSSQICIQGMNVTGSISDKEWMMMTHGASEWMRAPIDRTNVAAPRPKRSITKRLALGIYRFVKHVICSPLYLLASAVGNLPIGVGMAIHFFANKPSFQDLLYVSCAAPGIITFYVILGAGYILVLPFKILILTLKDEGDEEEKNIKEMLVETLKGYS